MVKIANFNKYLTSQKQVILNRNECLRFNGILTDYCRCMLFNNTIKTQKQEDKLYLGISRKDVLDLAIQIFDTNNLYISYSNIKNINKEINKIINEQEF